MIERILPADVVGVDLFHDPPGTTLFPEEEQVIQKAVAKRRDEFTTARLCARLALGKLGLPAAPILPGPRGEPQWPEGVIGSITHCAGYRGAVLGSRTRISTVGIDAEPNEPLPGGVLDAISLPQERAHLADLSAAHPGVHWDRALFCAKESVYKAWFPLAKRWLDFEEALITFTPGTPGSSTPGTLTPGTGGFHAELLVAGPEVDSSKLTGFDGRLLVDQGLILTAIVMTRA